VEEQLGRAYRGEPLSADHPEGVVRPGVLGGAPHRRDQQIAGGVDDLRPHLGWRGRVWFGEQAAPAVAGLGRELRRVRHEHVGQVRGGVPAVPGQDPSPAGPVPIAAGLERGDADRDGPGEVVGADPGSDRHRACVAALPPGRPWERSDA
jgi:hypothetical protein